MRIALVTIGEPLPVGPAAGDRPLRVGYFSQVLADRGHDVTWWTSTFDHARRVAVAGHGDRVAVRPGLELRFLDGGGYRRNVSLARLRDHRRLARELGAAIRREPRPDVIVSSLPPVELCLTSVEYGREMGVPVVLDVRDLWPDIFVDAVPAWARPIARIAMAPLSREARRACGRATAITAITPALLEFGLRHGHRAHTDLDRAFPMGYWVREPAPEARAAAERFWASHGLVSDTGTRVVCFFGNMGQQFDLTPAIHAARLLVERRLPVRFVLCGAGERLEEYRRLASGAPNVLLPGWIDEARIFLLLRRAFAGLDPLPNRYDYLASINNKAIEYLSAGVPVISTPAAGVLAETLARQRCGVSCAPDPDALAATVEAAIADTAGWAEKSANARRLFDAEFSAEHVYADFAAYLERLVAA